MAHTQNELLIIQWIKIILKCLIKCEILFGYLKLQKIKI